MVKHKNVVGTKSASSLQHNGKLEKLVVIEEKPTKPPGNPKFNRKALQTPTTAGGHDGNGLGDDALHDKITPASICQQLLTQGFVQSYVDFYHLTHRYDPSHTSHPHSSTHKDSSHMSPPSSGSVTTTLSIAVDDLIFIRDNLTNAELSRRQGNTSNVYLCYNKLADYYVQHKDWKTGFFFHEKCLEVSQLTNDVRAEMTANHSLGLINQLMNNYEKARIHHEKHEQLATSIDVFEEIARANTELYKVYLILAERHETSNQFEEGLEVYTLCLEAAKKSWDKAAEAEANGRIGNLLLNHSELQKCIPFLKAQSNLAADLGHPESRCRACSSLALAWDRLNQPEKALNELTLVHAISEQAGDAYLQSQACRALGTLYSKMGRLDSAVEILQRHFSLLKGILYRSGGSSISQSKGGKDAKEDPSKKLSSSDLDLARAYIGISKGNQQLGFYAIAIQYDFASLLDWKLNRSDLINVSRNPAGTGNDDNDPNSARLNFEDDGSISSANNLATNES
jgi:tetratricopeptide (TPR) repeat protein